MEGENEIQSTAGESARDRMTDISPTVTEGKEEQMVQRR